MSWQTYKHLGGDSKEVTQEDTSARQTPSQQPQQFVVLQGQPMVAQGQPQGQAVAFSNLPNTEQTVILVTSSVPQEYVISPKVAPLSITEIVLGVMLIIFNITNLVFYGGGGALISHGIWGGILVSEIHVLALNKQNF